MAAAGALLLGAALALGAYFAFRSDDGSPETAALPSPTPAMTATPAPSPLPTPSGTPGPSATPTVAPAGLRFSLGFWAKSGAWVFNGSAGVGSGYSEGESMPYLLRIDEARPGDVYGIRLRYDCRSGPAAAFDYLTGYDRNAGSAPALAAGGPSRLPPDMAAVLPGDSSTALDDAAREGERLLFLWGATFEIAPVGQLLQAPCAGDKVVQLAVRARAKTVFLLWGAHLASAADWGAGQGAADGDRLFSMVAQVSGVAPDRQAFVVDPTALSQ